MSNDLILGVIIGYLICDYLRKNQVVLPGGQTLTIPESQQPISGYFPSNLPGARPIMPYGVRWSGFNNPDVDRAAGRGQL